jgi:hypothetical protein
MTLSLFSLLLSKNQLCVNRAIAHEIGLYESIILFEIIDKFDYFENLGQTVALDENKDWFYLTLETIEERTTIPRRGQDAAIKNLISRDLIQVKISGLPAKRYFRIKKEKIMELFGIQEKSTSLYETYKLGCAKRTNLHVQNVQTAHYIQDTKEETNKGIVDLIEKPQTRTASPPRQVLFFNFSSRSFEGIETNDLASWKELYPDVDVDRELKKMAEWCLSNPSKAKSKKQWRRFITTWLESANEKNVNRHARNPYPKKEDVIKRPDFESYKFNIS